MTTSSRFRVARGVGASVELLDEGNQPVTVVDGFLRHLAARGCSPNTVLAYAYDLLHFWRFLAEVELTWDAFAPRHSLRFLEHLREVPSRRHAQRLGIALVVAMPDGEAQQRLSPATINRVLAAISSFYEFLIMSDQQPD